MKAAHTIESSTGLNKKTGAILAILAFTLVAMIVGYFLVNQVQNPAKRADEGEGVPLSGPNCPANGFTCKWTREPGVSYHYSIKEGDGTIVKEGDIPVSSGTDKITVTHTPQSGKTYTCSVVASNDCGTTSGEKAAACSSSPQPTIISSPTPTLTVTPSVTPEGTLTPTLTPTVTLTPTSGPSPTLPANVTPSKTPTPTDIIIVNATNTPKPGQPTSTPKETSNPTLPTTGGIPSLPALTVILVGFIIVTLGLVL